MAQRPETGLTLPAWIPALAGLALGLAYPIMDALGASYAAAYPPGDGYHLALWHGLGLALLCSAIAVGLGLALLILLGTALRLDVEDAATLGLVALFQVLTAPVISQLIGRSAYRAGSMRRDLVVVDELGARLSRE